MKDTTIKGNFTVNGQAFAQWFEQFRLGKANFQYPLNAQNFEAVMDKMPQMMCKPEISLAEFVGIFCFIYNETGGTFLSMKELGGAAHYARHGYSNKEAGRGLIQLTSASVYRVVLKELGYDYDAMTAEQLDALFLKENIYLPAVCIYLSHPQLAGGHWKQVQAGNTFAFGKAISGGANWYGTLYQNRCDALKKGLENEDIRHKNSPKQRYMRGFLTFLLLVFMLTSLYFAWRNRSKIGAILKKPILSTSEITPNTTIPT